MVKKEKSFFNFRSLANRFSHHGPVLLVNKAVVVFLGRSRSGEGDFFGMIVPIKLVIDEFSSVIGINP